MRKLCSRCDKQLYWKISVISTETSVEVINHLILKQRAKKVLSDSQGLVNFAIGLVNSVVNLPDGQVMFYEEFE